MATSLLETNQLTFTTDGVTIGARMTATADTFSFVGDSSAAVLLTGVASPVSGSDAATKSYVDAAAAGLDWKDAVVAATTVNGTLATAYANGQTIDGVVLTTGDRILIKDQTSGVENGIYTVNASGAPTRATDMPVGDAASGDAIFVVQGTLCAGCAYVCTNASGSDVVNTDALVFSPFAAPLTYTGGDGIDITGTSIAVDTTVVRTSGTQTVAGAKTFTSVVAASAGVTVPDSQTIAVGTGTDLTIQHNGTNSLVSSSGGDLIIDNTNVTGSTIAQLGTDTSATDFQVQNNSGTALFTVAGSGQVDVAGNIDASGGINIDADNQFLTIGAGGDLAIHHDGTDSVINSQEGSLYITNSAFNGNLLINNIFNDMILDNASAAGSTINRLGSTSAATDFQVQNSSSSALFTVLGSGQVDIGGNLDVTGGINIDADNVALTVGAGNDLSITHNGTNTVMTSTTGDLVIDNTNTIGSTIAQLGTDTNATDFQVQNNTGTGLFIVDGSGLVTVTSRIAGVATPTAGTDAANKDYVDNAATPPGGADTELQFNNAGAFGGISTVTTNGTNMSFSGGDLTLADNDSIIVGTGSDLTITHDATDSVVTSTTGNLVIDNTNATGETILRLGTDTNATYVGVHNNSDLDVVKFYADQTSTFNGDTTTHGDVVRNVTVATITTAGDTTYTATNMKGGIINRDPNGAARADTTDTAANIVANIHDCVVGSSYEFVVRNTADAAETITISGGTNVTTDGTFTVLQNEVRRFELVVTNATVSTEAVTIYALTSNGEGAATPPGGSTTQIQFNNAGSFGGISTITTDGTNMSFSGGDLTLADNDSIILGTGSDLTMIHNGTNSLFTSTTGDLIIDNTSATGSTIFNLGTDTAATDFQVQNDSASSALTIFGTGLFNLPCPSYSGAPGVVGTSFKVDGTTYTDSSTAGSGTATAHAFHAIAQPTLAATNASVTTTTAATLYIANAPAAGTNQTITSSYALHVAAGDVKVGGDVYGNSFSATSDATLKTNIHSLADPLRTLKKIEGYSYNWKDENVSKNTQWGVLAQQLEEVGLDNLVNQGVNKSVNYLGLVPLLIEAVKELSKEVEVMRKRR